MTSQAPEQKVPDHLIDSSKLGQNVAGAERITLDPGYPFEAVLIEMVKTHRRKRSDYAGDEGNPNQNFIDVAYQTGLTPGHSCEALIAVKQARLRVLLAKFWHEKLQRGIKDAQVAKNESVGDTLLDRAVYAVIACTLWQEGSYGRKPQL
jgi:hypothetical protein